MSTTFSLRSLGCARTLVDSESIIDGLNKIGFQWVQEGSKEPITILNTCSFIQAAIDETERNIAELIEQKKRGALRYIVVTGCYPSRFKPDLLKQKFSDVDLWFTTKEEDSLKTKLAELVFKKRFQSSTTTPYIKLTPSHYSYLKISEGCNNWCSFCTIPKIRGSHRSKPLDAIMADARKQIQMGAQELLVIAEDTTCWGEDLFGKPSLDILLAALATLPVRWIRPMYLFPSRITPALIDVIRNSPTIAPYIDMPIQHVNTSLLEAMNRKHTKNDLYASLDAFFTAIPDLAFRTTLITGFPGETDAHVEEVCDFLKRYPVAHLGCFTYSKERETRSARMADPVPKDVAQRRLDTIMKTQFSLLQTRQQTLIGTKRQVVYDGHKQCRSTYEAPEVDGLILLKSVPDTLAIGDTLDVTITGASGYDLLATAC